MSSTSQQVNLPPHLQLQQQKFDNYQLKWHSHLTNLNTAISTLYKNEKYADVMLFTCNQDENYCIPAHKLILSSYSSYFANIFDSNSLLNDYNKLIYIVLPPDITRRSIKILIQYMYNGEATVSKDIIQEVLHSGEVLKIRGLCRYNKSSTMINSSNNKNTNNEKNSLNIENNNNSQKIHVKEMEKLLPVNATKPNTAKGVGTSVIIKDNQNQNVIVMAKPLKQQQPIQKSFSNPTPISVNNISFLPGTTTGAGSVRTEALPATTSTNSLKKITLQRYANETNSNKLDESNIIKENIFLNETKGIKRKNSLNYLNDKDNENSLSNEAITNNNNASNNSNKRTATSIERTISNEMIFTPDELNFLTIKQEPMEWPNYNEDSLDIINGSNDNLETIIKPEALSFDSDDSNENNEFTKAIYSPLTCDVCNEVFTLPADWVKHIESHSEQSTHTRDFSEDNNSDTENAILTCNLCSLNFLTPADWVRHVQNSHTERELALSNKKTKPRQSKDDGLQLDTTCSICNKKFPSNASMNIHKNTHREDKTYYCTFCHRGFSVKSNLTRHIRTLHKSEQISKHSNDNGNDP